MYVMHVWNAGWFGTWRRILMIFQTLKITCTYCIYFFPVYPATSPLIKLNGLTPFQMGNKIIFFYIYISTVYTNTLYPHMAENGVLFSGIIEYNHLCLCTIYSFHSHYIYRARPHKYTFINVTLQLKRD